MHAARSLHKDSFGVMRIVRMRAARKPGFTWDSRYSVLTRRPAATGRKTQHFVHLFYDEASRACVATAQGIAVALDLKTRKAIELPEARRRRIEAGLLRLPR